MEYEIVHRPSYALGIIRLDRNESLNAESGAMVSMSVGMEIETSMKGGLLSSLKRKLLGGESFFMNTFTASRPPGEITIAPALPGDIKCVEMKGETIYVQSGSYLASSTTIDIDTKWGGAKTFFSKEGLFLLKLTGTGNLFISSYGAIHDRTLKRNETYIVDTGHMVAFDESVQYGVKRVGGIKSTLFSGEGLVCELTGPGNIMIQTRSEDQFLTWLIPKIPVRRD